MIDGLGLTLLHEGPAAEALDLLGQAFTVFSRLGERAGEAHTGNSLGEAMTALGRPDQARDRHTAALALATELGDGFPAALPSTAPCHVPRERDHTVVRALQVVEPCRHRVGLDVRDAERLPVGVHFPQYDRRVVPHSRSADGRIGPRGCRGVAGHPRGPAVTSQRTTARTASCRDSAAVVSSFRSSQTEARLT
ncbi:tetratricopeptide repeat protein [Actinoplanes sp. NPDC051851]|uniref:tetratricopeptide repeat protein n=1 Tax=Actinoplanes sp. NPDC051851 TaxID=3154753 RepID=UPI003428F142